MSDIKERLRIQSERGLFGLPNDFDVVTYGDCLKEIERLEAELENEKQLRKRVDDRLFRTFKELYEKSNELAKHKWRTDMENAPRDGTHILICEEQGHIMSGNCDPVIGWFNEDGWISYDEFLWTPTHWKPLDKPDE